MAGLEQSSDDKALITATVEEEGEYDGPPLFEEELKLDEPLLWKLVWEGQITVDEDVEWTVRILLADPTVRMTWEVIQISERKRAMITLDRNDLIHAKMDPRLPLDKLVNQAVHLCKQNRLLLSMNHDVISLILSHPIEASDDTSLEYEFTLENAEWDWKDDRITELMNDNVKNNESQVRKVEKTIETLTMDLGEEVRKRDEIQTRLDLILEKIMQEGLGEWHRAIDKDWMGRTSELDENGNPLFIAKLKDYRQTLDEWDLRYAQYLYIHRRNLEANVKYEWRGVKGRLHVDNALHYCAMHPCLNDMLRWLLHDRSIDPSEKSEDEWSDNPLMRACIYGNSEAVRWILEDGRVDKDAGDFTALIHAANNNKPTVVRILIEHGCDPKKKDQSGKTALDRAVKKGFEEVAAFLDPLT